MVVASDRVRGDASMVDYLKSVKIEVSKDKSIFGLWI